ncbi:unnamed protein product [Diamesa hyperborea]
MQLISFDTKEDIDQFISVFTPETILDAWVGYTDEAQSAPLLKVENDNTNIFDANPTEEHLSYCEYVVTTNVLQPEVVNMELHYKKENALLVSKLKLVEAENENQKNQLKVCHNSSSHSSQDRYNEYENRINELEKQVNKLTDALQSINGIKTPAMYCDYDNINNVYSCSTEGLEILMENVEIAVTGDHHVDKTNEDVIELNISDSKTKFLSNSLFHYFERLRKIQIVKSQLQSLSNGVFSGAEYLRKVFIQGNNIKSIDSNTFKGADNLNVLNLDNNQIEFVAKQAFDGLEYLTTLILVNNKLKKIPTNTMNTLYNLMYLKLSANQFDKLDGSLLKNNTLLREVWFDRNIISNIGSELLTYSDRYQRVVFSDNICIDNDSEHTGFDTVQKEIIKKCSGIDPKKGSNAKEWAKCPPKNDKIDLGFY